MADPEQIDRARRISTATDVAVAVAWKMLGQPERTVTVRSATPSPQTEQ